jgi:hypothetical protein
MGSESGHRIKFQEIKEKAKAMGYKNRLVKDPMKISLHPHNFGRFQN